MQATFALETLEQLRAAGVGEVYEALEGPERLRLFTARAEGQLVGYCAYFVRHNGHYKSSLQALQDLLVMLPEHSDALEGLLTFAEQQLRAEGVQIVYQRKRDTGELLGQLGYELIETLWAKALDRS